MSWFDTSGLAELAKNALKEAQKTIDKALDIQDEDLILTTTTSPINSSNKITPITSGQQQQKCKTEPTTPVQPLWQATNPALWGSFTGSFFENSKADEMITTPPKCGLLSTEGSQIINSKRQSVHSNSDSIEILSSSPATPCSGSNITSPSITVYHSESVEIITTPTSCEILSPDSENSAEIFEDEDDSMSFNTVMDESLSATVQTNNLTTPPSSTPKIISSTSSSEQQAIQTAASFEITNSCESVKTLTDSSFSERNLEKNNLITISNTGDSLLDSQTLLSDSTQSFEDVQIPENFSVSEDKELIKTNSGVASGHNSADEVETTTTSSDIEIISNPNGDSSSTNSACRTSPLKSNVGGKKNNSPSEDFKFLSKKGHCREPSEVSTQSDDSQLSNGSETDKLLRRISELSEILESREIRLIEMGKQNAELQEKNSEYEALLEARQRKKDPLETEEYTQRLSALEKKFQMSIRERDSLRDQLKILRNELTTKIPKDNLEKVVAEKDFIIEELRTEGEKLSKQILQHSNIIKKLRSKEKETDSTLKRNKEQITELTEEVERLKKSLTAKEEVERSQIEAVHKLSSEKRKLEKENELMKSQLEDCNSKVDSLQISLDTAKKELQEKQNAHQELSKKSQALSALETKKQQTENQNAEILSQMEDLKKKLQISETGNSLREQKLRQDNADLLRRLEAAEIRCEELTQEISGATIPLVRQLEALQSTLALRTNSWEKQEKELSAKLEESQKKLRSLENIENASKEVQQVLNQRIKLLEERLSSTLLKTEQANSALQQAELNCSLKENEYKKQIEELKAKLDESNKKYDEIKINFLSIEKNLELESTMHRKTDLPEENEEINKINDRCHSESNQQNQQQVSTNSPTGSLRRNSLADSLGSAWQMDDLECISNSDRLNYSNGGVNTNAVYGLTANFNQISGHSATIFENLQSSLKQRDGEISQLQWELSRLGIEKNVLNEEISNLTLEIESLKDKLSEHEILEKEHEELQRKYDALLQMYGEKVEEAQELELDLQDVKEMYKAQIDELLKQKNLNSILP